MTIPYTALCKQPRIDLNTSPLAAPLNLYVETCNQCNYRCSCCPESRADFFEKQNGKHVLGWADWESVAAKIEEFGPKPVLKSLHFYMLGEPLLNRATTEFIFDATRRCLAEKTILTTNGVLVGKYASAISASGLTYLRVSLYDEYRKDWEKIAQGLLVLSTTIPHPFIYVKSFTDDPDVEMFRDIADEVEVVRTHNWNGTGGTLGGEWTGAKKVCPMPFYTLVVHSNLEVSACCVDWDRKVKVGDLRTQTLKDVWNGETMHRLRIDHLEGRKDRWEGCKDCTVLHQLQDTITLTADEYMERVGSNGRLV